MSDKVPKLDSTRDLTVHRSIAIYQDQQDFVEMDSEERGIGNYNVYFRWMVDKQMKEKDRMFRIDSALDLGDLDTVRAIIGEILD